MLSPFFFSTGHLQIETFDLHNTKRESIHAFCKEFTEITVVCQAFSNDHEPPLSLQTSRAAVTGNRALETLYRHLFPLRKVHVPFLRRNAGAGPSISKATPIL
jgi:hypothetical protein